MKLSSAIISAIETLRQFGETAEREGDFQVGFHMSGTPSISITIEPRSDLLEPVDHTAIAKATQP